MEITIEQIKKLRGETAAGITDCRNALQEAGGDFKKAKAILREREVAQAAGKADREVCAGLVEAYIHAGGRVGALVELKCETDFVARNDFFKQLAHNIAMQVASMAPKDVDKLLAQAYIRDPQKTVKELVTEAVAKLGENIKVGRFARFEI